MAAIQQVRKREDIVKGNRLIFKISRDSYLDIASIIKIGTRTIVQLKMFGPFVSKTSTFEHLYRVKQLLVTVGDDKEGDINKTITDAIILGTLLMLS